MFFIWRQAINFTFLGNHHREFPLFHLLIRSFGGMWKLSSISSFVCSFKSALLLHRETIRFRWMAGKIRLSSGPDLPASLLAWPYGVRHNCLSNFSQQLYPSLNLHCMLVWMFVCSMRVCVCVCMCSYSRGDHALHTCYLKAILCCRERLWTTSTGEFADAPWTAWTGVTCCPWRRVSCRAACQASAKSPTKTQMSRLRKIHSPPVRCSPAHSL